MFKNVAHEKSILILQKPFLETKPLTDVLLAQVPNMSDKNAMARFLQEIDQWAKRDKLTKV